jgi:hypothetical protein
VHASQFGPLLARDDRRVALLDRSDGHVVWQRRFEEALFLRLHVCGTTADVLWQSQAAAGVDFIQLPSGVWRRHELPALRPVWSALTPAGLVMVHAAGILILDNTGQLKTCRLPQRVTLLANTLRLVPGTAGTPRLLFGSTDGQLRLLDLQSAAVVWAQPDQPAATPDWDALLSDGRRVFVASREGVNVRSLETGQLVCRVPAMTMERLVLVVQAGESDWLLWRRRPELCLRELRWPAEPGGQPESGSPRPGATLQLAPTDVLLRALSAGGRLIIVTRDGLRAYVLP